MAEPIARQALATGGDPEQLARALVDLLAAPMLQIAFVFSDHRLGPAAFAGMQRLLSVPVVGCTALGVLGPGTVPHDAPAAVGLGLYGAVRAGVGIVTGLSKAALVHSRTAVDQAAAALGITTDALERGRHVAITLVDGSCLREEAFCIAAGGAAPKIPFVGGSASSMFDEDLRSYVWANGHVLSDAGVVIVLDCEQPFHAVSSSHLVPTELRTVVTSVRGRVIDELDGRPAAPRLRHLLASIGERLDEPRPSHALARYIDGTPYVRSIYRVAGERLILAYAVEAGQVLHVMRPGDLLGATRRDLQAAAERVGGTMAAFLAFSAMARDSEAAIRGTGRELAATYASYPTVGMHSLGEQRGMLLLNHTLTGLAIGAPTT